MKRKCLPLLFILMVVGMLLFGAPSGAEGENLLYNGDFTVLNKDGLPEGWFVDAYRLDPGYSVFSMTAGPDGEETAVLIRNTAKNDARLAQTVSVRPESLYRLSATVRADDVQEGHGANLSVEGLYAFSEKKYDTRGQWETIEYYGETGPDQYEITVFARLGGYSGESKGAAAFCNLSLTEVEGLPDGVLADLWYEPDTDYGEDGWDDETPADEEKEAGPAWPALTAIALLGALLSVALIYVFRDGKGGGPALPSGEKLRTGPVLALALLLRIVVSFLVEGYSVDVNCFLSWGATMAQNGPAGFYQATSFCDYPPLYTYVIGLNSWLSNALGADAAWTRVIFRLVPCLCDVAACGMLLFWAKTKENRSDFYTKLILLLLAFNPATILNSAAWGQMDSVLCLLLLGVAAFAVEEKWIASMALYVTAVLVKPQALMLGPLGLAYMILAVVHDRKQLKKILTGIAAGMALMAVYILPFGIRQEFGWLIRRYSETLSSYPYATVNTANFYYLLGGNWNAVSNPAHLLAPLLFAAACAVHGAVWFMKNRERKLSWIETVLSALFVLWFAACAFFGLSWAFTGAGAMAFAFVIVISMATRNGGIRFLPYLGALLFILLYVFGVKMHERYLFPALVLLMFAWVLHRDRRILYLLILFSSTVFVNEGIVLDNSIRLGASLGHLNNDTVFLADLLSVLNVTGAVLAVLLGYALMKDKVPGGIRQLPAFLPVKKAEKIPERKLPDRKLHWNKKDTVILLCITALFSILTLTTLGSNKAPQTAWTSSGEEEQVVIDLGQEYDDVRMLYFAQVSRENFRVAASDDGVEWDEDIWAQMDQGQCWKWKYLTQSWDDGNGGRTFYNDTDYIHHLSGRYIRITSGQVGLTLNEVIFRDAEGNTIPAKIVSRTGDTEGSALRSDPENLLDEQDTLENLPRFFGLKQEGEAQPSWWNSTYFDEIYHARTGFEFLNGTVPYETSHPPLGKIFISWAVALFGMTPFGWRFAGALAGILMLPGIYLLAKQLTKKTWPAAFACALMALDCMHLTQTQIATIDSFPVLFILFAFFFMLRFAQTDLRSARLKESLVPLACSGFFMGLSIASKWIGIYAGMGLAVVFFAHCILQIRAGLPLRRFWILCLWCIPFFVLVPLVIYLISYIPYMAYNTRIGNFGDYLAAVWRAQESMLSYHSTPGLGMDHPFYSPWWEWPVIGKPMYYASKQYLAPDAPLSHSIFSFGNPVVWWGALPALLAAVVLRIRDRHYLLEGSPARWHLKSFSGDRRYGFVFVGLLAQYLPWVLVPRGTYIYHYFASVPFLILILSLLLSDGDGIPPKAARIAGGCFLGLALVFFVILLPYAAGMASPLWWLDIGKNILHIWY